MYNPFHDIPPRDAALDRSSSSRSTRYHVNNPLHHRFPLLKRMQEFLVLKFHVLMPALDHIPHRAHMFFGFLYVLAMLALFLFFFLTGMQSARNQWFLSPLANEQTQTASRNCELITATHTGTFYATKDGFWQGNEQFEFSKAMFVLTISSKKTPPEFYQMTIGEVIRRLGQRGQMAQSLDLAKNLLMWSTIAFSADATNAQRVTLSGNPVHVLNREFHEATLGSASKRCNKTAIAAYDSASGVASAVLTKASCTDIMRPELFARAGADHIDMDFDVRSVMTAVSVNFMVLFAEMNIVRADTTFRNYTVAGKSYIATAYFDSRHPGMRPIFCFDKNQFARTWCIVEVGGVPVFPFFHHLGQSKLIPAPCTCSSLSATALEDKMHPCHAFNFLIGFYYWNSYDITPLFAALSKFPSPVHFHEAGYPAAFLSSSFGIASPHPMVQNATNRYKAFDFCRNNITNMACSAFVLSAYDVHGYDRTISDFLFSVEKGACRDSFSPEPSSAYSMLSQTFAPLFQEYQKCQYDSRTLLLNQAGITIGNLQIFSPLAILGVFILGMLYRVFLDKPDVVEQYENMCNLHYTKVEKQKVLEAFAISMLVHRDRIIVDRLKAKGKDKSTDESSELFHASTMHRLVEDVVDHFNESEVRQEIVDFLATRGDEEEEDLFTRARKRVAPMPRPSVMLRQQDASQLAKMLSHKISLEEENDHKKDNKSDDNDNESDEVRSYDYELSEDSDNDQSQHTRSKKEEP